MNDPISMLTPAAPASPKMGPLAVVHQATKNAESSQQLSPSAALYELLDPLTQEELIDDVQLHLEFEEHAAKLLEIAKRLGVSFEPEDPRGAEVLDVLERTGMPMDQAALMVANKARKAAAGWQLRYGPDTVHRYVKENERFLVRPT